MSTKSCPSTKSGPFPRPAASNRLMSLTGCPGGLRAKRHQTFVPVSHTGGSARSGSRDARVGVSFARRHHPDKCAAGGLYARVGTLGGRRPTTREWGSLCAPSDAFARNPDADHVASGAVRLT